MEIPIFSYKVSFDTRPLGRKGTLQMRFGSGPDVVIPNLDASQTSTVALILSGATPTYDPVDQTVASIRIIQLPPHADIANMIVNPVSDNPFGNQDLEVGGDGNG